MWPLFLNREKWDFMGSKQRWGFDPSAYFLWPTDLQSLYIHIAPPISQVHLLNQLHETQKVDFAFNTTIKAMSSHCNFLCFFFLPLLISYFYLLFFSRFLTWGVIVSFPLKNNSLFFFVSYSFVCTYLQTLKFIET